MRYRTLWLYGWGIAALVCIGLAPLMWPFRTVVLLFVVGAVATGTVTFGYLTRDNAAAPARGNLAARTAVAACLGGAGITALAASAKVAGSLTLPLLLLCALSSPWVVDRISKKASPARPGLAEAPSRQDVVPYHSGLPAAQDVHDDRELCRLWRASFSALQSARLPSTRERIVALRQAYLDELERRDPSALAAWLASGPQAAGGPEQFLSGPEGEDFRRAS